METRRWCWKSSSRIRALTLSTAATLFANSDACSAGAAAPTPARRQMRRSRAMKCPDSVRCESRPLAIPRTALADFATRHRQSSGRASVPDGKGLRCCRRSGSDASACLQRDLDRSTAWAGVEGAPRCACWPHRPLPESRVLRAFDFSGRLRYAPVRAARFQAGADQPVPHASRARVSRSSSPEMPHNR